MKKLSKSLFALVLLFSAAAAARAQPAHYIEGTHYAAIDEPVRTVAPDKIEVIYIFSYGCQHCYNFEPLLDSWVAKLPSDVVFARSPGTLDQMMKTHAQIFYTARELKVLDQIHGDAFNEIHQRRNSLQSPDQIRALFVARGVVAATFDKAWVSFQVSSSVRQSDTRMRACGVRVLPHLIVNGKYRITTGVSVPTQADMLRVAGFLIEKERGR